MGKPIDDFSIATVSAVWKSGSSDCKFASLIVEHGPYSTNDILEKARELHNIRTRARGWPVSRFSLTMTHEVPKDIQVGDKVEVRFAYAGYWTRIAGRAKQSYKYQIWKERL